MKFLIEVDQQTEKGKLTIGLIKEMGFEIIEMPSAADFALPSDKKINGEVLNYLLDEAEISDSLILKEEIVKYTARKKK